MIDNSLPQILNTNWDDERLFQESRRIVIAEIQHITYSDYLPLLIGDENVQKYGLKSTDYSITSGFMSDYDLNVNADVLNEFAAAAALFFYSNFDGKLRTYDKHGYITVEGPLSDYLYDPSLLHDNDGFEAIVR